MKINKDIILKIIHHESKFHPRNLYCKLIDISDDSIRLWITKGEKLYNNKNTLFNIPQNIEEFKNNTSLTTNEMLIFLYDIINKLKIESTLSSFDDILETGSKNAFRSYAIKNKLSKDPYDLSLDNIMESLPTPEKPNKEPIIIFTAEQLTNMENHEKQTK